MSEVRIRRATEADTATIAGIHVRAWQWAYRGLLPVAFLDGLSIAEREPNWRKQLVPDYPRHTWLAEVDGQALGFVTCGPSGDPEQPQDTGEIFAIYQEERAAGTGIGRALFSHATSELLVRGFRVGVLWVLQENARARRFYEAAGWKADGAVKEDVRSDQTRREVRYTKDLR